MLTELESIRNNTLIANKFIGYTGLIVAIIGSFIAFFISGKAMKPIVEMTDISKRMKILDFSAKSTTPLLKEQGL